MADDNPVMLVDRFFDRTRRTIHEAAVGTDLRAAWIGTIAGDAAARYQFRDEFRRINDTETRDRIVDFLDDIVADLESSTEKSDIKVDFVDRVVLAPAGSLTVAGIVALASATGLAATAAPFVLAAGMIGLIVTGLGRTILKSRIQSKRAMARKIRQLREFLA